MRVLISTLWLGGAGGSERAVKSALAALEGEFVDVVAGSVIAHDDLAAVERTRVLGPSHWRWRGANAKGRYGRLLATTLANPIRRQVFPPYDLHISFPHSHDIAEASRAALRLVIPGGSTPPSLGADDVVALEAPDNDRFVPTSHRSVLLPPPLGALAPTVTHPRVALPPEFFLTVFNPYAPIKGESDLAAIADDAPLPIVWCHSERTLNFEISRGLADHPNIVHVVDAAPSELRFLYEACYAYLAFSRSEGFGWAAADALQYSRSIVTRPIGVFSFEESHQHGVHLIEGPWEFEWGSLNSRPQVEAPHRDLKWLSPSAYLSRLVALVEESQ